MFGLRLKISILAVFLLLVSPVQAYYELDKPDGFVSDLAQAMTVEQAASLEAKLTQFEKDTSNEIAVVFINDLQGDTIENFAVKLFEDWGIGKEDKDNGILFLAATEERKVRIEVGYGLEGALTDLQSNKILTDIVSPTFKNGDYYNGTSLAVDRMMAVVAGEYTAEPGAGVAKMNAGLMEEYFWLVIFGFYVLVALKRYLAKSKSWWEGGIVGAVLGAIISLIFFSSFLIFSIIFFAAAGLGFDFLVSRFKVFQNKPGSKNNNFWFFGGPRGGSGSSGGGFGGFGGGFSGGGGSSGSW